MLGRKVAKVAEQLNSYLVEIGRPEEQYTGSQVNNKIGSTKAKGRDCYKKYFKQTTGSSADDGSGRENVDLSAAFAVWNNFRIYHECFGDHLTWGPRNTIREKTE